MLSYNDAWMLLLLTFLLVSPAILLLRRHRGAARGAGGRALSEPSPRRPRRPEPERRAAALPRGDRASSRSFSRIRAARSGATGTPAPGPSPRASWTKARSCSMPRGASSRRRPGSDPNGPFLPLGSVRQKAGKVVHAWAWEGDADPRGSSATRAQPSGRRARGGGSPIPRSTAAPGSIPTPPAPGSTRRRRS